MDKNIRAAIIGYVRQGATLNDIVAMTGVREEIVIAIIELYSIQN